MTDSPELIAAKQALYMSAISAQASSWGTPGFDAAVASLNPSQHPAPSQAYQQEIKPVTSKKPTTVAENNERMADELSSQDYHDALLWSRMSGLDDIAMVHGLLQTQEGCRQLKNQWVKRSDEIEKRQREEKKAKLEELRKRFEKEDEEIR